MTSPPSPLFQKFIRFGILSQNFWPVPKNQLSQCSSFISNLAFKTFHSVFDEIQSLIFVVQGSKFVSHSNYHTDGVILVLSGSLLHQIQLVKNWDDLVVSGSKWEKETKHLGVRRGISHPMANSQAHNAVKDKQTNSEEPKVLPNLWTQGHKIEVCVQKCCVISLKDKV